jgi:hypothetical protein
LGPSWGPAFTFYKPNDIPIENPIVHMVVSKIGGYAAPVGPQLGPAFTFYKPNDIPIENPIVHMVVSKIGGYAAPVGAQLRPSWTQPCSSVLYCGI